MILKHIHRSDRWPGFRTGCKSREDCVRLARYLLRESAHPTVLRNDFAGDTPEDIGDELADQHQGQTVWAYHVVASYPPGEHALWAPQAETCIQELQNTCQIRQGFWVQHRGHWHGLLLAMKPNGGTVRLGSYKGGEPVTVARTFRELAEGWEDHTPGCQKTGRGEHRLDLSRDSIAAAARQYLTKKAPTPIPKKLLLKAAVDRIVALSGSFDELHANAAAAGVAVQYRSDDAGRVLGISFAKDGVSLRGREAGHAYPQLQALYEHTPDIPAAALRRHPHMAAGARHPHRRPGDPQSPTRNRVPDGDPAIPPFAANPPGGAHPGHPAWIEAAFRALSPREPTYIDFLCTLSGMLTRILNQNDYERPWHPPHPPL